MDTIKNAANYVSDTAKSATAGASKEANKSVAKDNNAPVGSRISAGVDALGDKKDEKKHDISAEGNKQAATH